MSIKIRQKLQSITSFVKISFIHNEFTVWIYPTWQIKSLDYAVNYLVINRVIQLERTLHLNFIE